MTSISFARHQFPPDVIRHAVWLYLRFTLSLRDVEEMLAERGLNLTYETVRRWVTKFGPLFARELRKRRQRPTGRWHLDEMVVKIAGKRHWLWRAVDDEGEVLDILVQSRRDTRAAVRLMRKLIKKQGGAGQGPYVDGPRLQGSWCGFGCDRLRSYVRPFGCGRTRPLAKMVSAMRGPNTPAASERQWPLRCASRLGSIDPTICSFSCKHRRRAGPGGCVDARPVARSRQAAVVAPMRPVA